jgi:hypothetical protein
MIKTINKLNTILRKAALEPLNMEKTMNKKIIT